MKFVETKDQRENEAVWVYIKGFYCNSDDEVLKSAKTNVKWLHISNFMFLKEKCLELLSSGSKQ